MLQHRKKPYRQRIIKTLHLWLGLTLGLPLVLLGLTGSTLVILDTVENLSTPAITHNLAGTAHTIEEILDAARIAAQDGMTPVQFRPGHSVTAPVTIRLSQAPHGKSSNVQMLIDPVTLVILDKDISSSLASQIFMLHSSLLLRDYGGRNMVGLLGISLLFMGISGIITWWPKPKKWKNSIRIKHGAKGFRLYRDLHGVAGMWGFIVLVTVSCSGIYLAFPQFIGPAIGKVFPARDLKTIPEFHIRPMPGQRLVNADEATVLALNKVPGSRLLAVMLPSKPNQPYRINIAPVDYSNGEPAITVFIDQCTGNILEIRNPKDFSTGETIITWQRTIHAGQGFGWTWRILVFIMGTLPALFAITGFLVWNTKRKARMHRPAARISG